MDVQLSVVIPAYNADRYISKCLDSILTQEDSPTFEVVVVDDGSTDDTAAIVEQHFPSVRLIRKPNGGPGSGRNCGVAAARGEVIIFIDADDLMLPGRLAFQGGFMLSRPDVGLSFGNQIYERRPNYDSNYANGLCSGEDFTIIEEMYERLMKGDNIFPNTASAVRKEAYVQTGGQPEDILMFEDFAMNCAIARCWPVAASRRFVTWYRQGHGGNLTSNVHHYKGSVVARGRELRNAGFDLQHDVYQAGFQNWLRWAEKYFFKLWIEEGRGPMRAEISAWRDLLPWSTTLKWWIISVVPPIIGAWVRTMRRWSLKLAQNSGGNQSYT
jgi:glycosyltransferase involved in cell wall biosynthesis